MGSAVLDDGFPEHPKVVGLSLEARWAFIESLCYAAKYETDGVVPDVVAANGSVREELLAAGLWESGTAAVIVHDFLVYNRSRTEKERKRNRARTIRASRAVVSSRSDSESSSRSGDIALGEGGLGEGEAFAQFWNTYPRKVGKPKARLAFSQALRYADFEAILAGAKRYAEDPNREDEFTAHPTTWLHRDGWEDEALPDRRSREKPGARPTASRAEVDEAMRKAGIRP